MGLTLLLLLEFYNLIILNQVQTMKLYQLENPSHAHCDICFLIDLLTLMDSIVVLYFIRLFCIFHSNNRTISSSILAVKMQWNPIMQV